MNQIVPLEIAKALKLNGYKKPTNAFYQDKDLPFSKNGLKYIKYGRKMNNNKYDEYIYSAPTYAEYYAWCASQNKQHEDDGN